MTPENSPDEAGFHFNIQPEFGSFYYEEKNDLGSNRVKNFLLFGRVNYHGVTVNRPHVSFENSFTLDYYYNLENNQSPVSDLSLYSVNLSDLLKLKSLVLNFYLFPENTDLAVIHLGRIVPIKDRNEKKFLENYTDFLQLNGLSTEFFNTTTGYFQLIFLDILGLYQSNINDLYSFYGYPDKENLVIGQNNDDTFSFRTGLTYKTPDFFKHDNELTGILKFSFIFTRYGSVFGGNDNYSFNGDQVENDYIFYYSINCDFKSPYFSLLTEVAYTDGIDRRLPDYTGNSRDILANGMMGRAGILVWLLKNKEYSHYLIFDFLYTEGPAYNNFNEKTNYGFTGLLNPELSYPVIGYSWGLSPYAISTPNGILNNNNMDSFHSSGMMNVEIKTGFEVLDKMDLSINSIFLFDTENAGTNYMGNETAINLSVRIFKKQMINFIGGVFFPGEGYKDIFPGMYTDDSDVILAFCLKVEIYF